MRAISFAGLLLAAIAGCRPAAGLDGLALADLQGAVWDLGALAPEEVTAFVFLSPECPLCERYAPALQAVADSFGPLGVQVLGVFPGEWYPEEQLRRFARHYKLHFPMLLDSSEALARRLNARITPEVFVFRGSSDLIYRGKIDNWAVSLGKKRLVATEPYLASALTAALRGAAPDPAKTEAVGCLIQYSRP